MCEDAKILACTEGRNTRLEIELDVSTYLGLELGDQDEAFGFYLICPGKLEKDLEQGTTITLCLDRFLCLLKANALGHRVKEELRTLLAGCSGSCL